MAIRGVSARAIAKGAGLFIVRVADRAELRQDGPVLYVGADADEHTIATLGCRRMLTSIGVADERVVRLIVENCGYCYVSNDNGRLASN